MIPNWQMALEDLASIEAAVDLRPEDWATAQKVWEQQLDYATLSLFEQVEPGQAPAAVDPRIDDVRRDIELLYKVLKAKDRTTVNSLLLSITQKVRALAGGAAPCLTARLVASV
jgi:hypothetical protein